MLALGIKEEQKNIFGTTKMSCLFVITGHKNNN